MAPFRWDYASNVEVKNFSLMEIQHRHDKSIFFILYCLQNRFSMASNMNQRGAVQVVIKGIFHSNTDILNDAKDE